ncbi:hypothetical protein PhCBS80983_g00803 [Powellomyces hirtus]|uniref:Hexosyltransferase n=1 Tax=Powellomyces hirtus TaxID=109895 RepID=A0A507EF53_9FUNG|nr:hypothetical protein PhCBS80983_g00803 [Powellomyces hirtus]
MHALLRIPVVLPLVATILLMLLVQSTRRQVSCRVGAPLDVESVDSIASVRDEVRQLRELVENDTHRRHEDKSLSDPPGESPKTVLVGLLTVPSKLQRRALIRSTYLQIKPPEVDFFFVFGTPATLEDARLLEWEQRLYKDIIIIDCEENMDSGKTFHFFDHVARTFPDGKYPFVMKTDDDVWLHLPNLAERLQSSPRQGTYFGRSVQDSFMAGMGYAVSWDIVKWISTDSFPGENKIGQEDAMLAWWLQRGQVIKNWISEDYEFYDDPSFKEGWAHDYTPGTILVHRLKNETLFIRASAHFLEPQKTTRR